MSHLMTVAALYETGCTQREATLFEERHVKREPPVRCSSEQVIQAHRNLDLIDKLWPTQHEAAAEVAAIQAELDRMILN